MQPGWYPDPDDDQARRYWDGASWSAPLPVTQPPAEPAPAAEVAPGGYAVCAVDWCNQPRALDSEHCTQHGREARGERGMASAWTEGKSQIVCPHCQVRGQVKSKAMKQKKGVSGGKATGAVLTLGVSMLATGLSRKEKVTQMKCGNCNTVWYV